MRTTTLTLLCVAAVGAIPRTATALDPVTLFVVRFGAEYLAGAGIDALWDKVSNKPDIQKIDSRLQQLESNAAMRSEMREEIRKVRKQITERVTKDELRKLLGGLESHLTDIRKRITDLEERLELQEVKLDDLTNGTKKAQDAFVFYLRGSQFAIKKDTYRALANLSLAVRMDAKAGGALVARGAVYASLGAFEVAAIDYAEAIRRDAKDIDARLGRGVCLCRIGQHRDAIPDLTLVLQEEPKHPVALLHRGQSRERLGLYRDAATDLAACVAVAPERADAWRQLGACRLRLANPTGAIEAYTEALKRKPSDPECLSGRCSAYFTRGRNADAQTDADEAIRLGTTDRVAYEVRGLCRYYANKDADALADLTAAVSRGSNRAEVYRSRGHLYLKRKEYASAEADLSKALRLGDTSWRTSEDRAIARYNLKQHAGAIDDFAAVLKANPNPKTVGFAHWWTAQAHKVLGNTSGYRQQIDKAIAADADWQKKQTSGHVRFTNKSKSNVVVDVDLWIDENGKRQKFTFTSCKYDAAPGESFYLLYEKKPITASRFEAYIKTSKGKKGLYWTYNGGSTLEATISDADLP